MISPGNWDATRACNSRAIARNPGVFAGLHIHEPFALVGRRFKLPGYANYRDTLFMNAKRVIIKLVAVGSPRPVGLATERRLLSLIYRRAVSRAT